MQVVVDSVKKNQTLSDMLIPFQVPQGRISQIAREAKEVFDIRKIRTGKKYSIYLSNDTAAVVNYFVYEEDPINYVVFDVRDSISVYKKQKEVKVKENFASGIIQSSLYLTLENQNFNPELALNLSEVYAWQIDFYRIQKGDKFKVIYEEKFLEGQSVGIGRILAAVFNHKGEDYYSFYFDQDESDNYFDENGNCLRREFLRSPIKFSRISSGFSRRRFHPVLKRYKAHLGVDFAAPIGTPIRAIGSGTVLEARYKGGNGNYVKIKHNSTYMSGYLHLSKFGKGIKPGSKVEQGQKIGYVGTTGLFFRSSFGSKILEEWNFN